MRSVAAPGWAEWLRLARAQPPPDPRALTGELIEDVARLSRRGVQSVPRRWQGRLERLAALVPAPPDDLRTGVAMVALLDALFEIEGSLEPPLA